MNRVLGGLIVCLLATDVYARTEQPHTIYIPRSISAYPFLIDQYGVDLAKKNCIASLSHTAIYQESSNATKNVPFFFGDDTTQLAIKENELGDINSDWLHVESAANTEYASILKIAPKRTVFGICFRNQYSLAKLFEGLWAAVVVPVVSVTHELRPLEIKAPTTRVADGSQFDSVLNALDWDNWRAGKWSQEEQSIIGLDDVIAQLGLTIKGPLGSTQDISLEIALPLGHRPTGQYLFEPLIGSQGSVGLGSAIKTVVPLVSFGGLQVSYVGSVAYRYYLKNNQLRLFDLKGQPFSRYLVYMDIDLVPHVSNVIVKASNGNNFFMRDTMVIPGGTGTSVTSLQASYANYKVQAGYLYWWRVAEQVTFAAPLDRTFAVPSPRGLSSGDSPVPIWLSGAQITDKFSADDLAVSSEPAVAYDIEFDIDSGAMPQAASHTLFADLQGAWEGDVVCATVKVGIAYEFAKTPAVFDSLHAWCGIGITF